MGHVAFLEAAPGDADLITLRGARRRAEADVVLHDALTDPALPADAAAGPPPHAPAQTPTS